MRRKEIQIQEYSKQSKFTESMDIKRQNLKILKIIYGNPSQIITYRSTKMPAITESPPIELIKIFYMKLIKIHKMPHCYVSYWKFMILPNKTTSL